MTESASSSDPGEGTLYATSTLGTPGATLRAAREQAGLSLDEVAVQTKISVSLLQAIEHDDLARLGQPVYARGYLRRYAKAMSVPETSVLAALDPRDVPTSPAVASAPAAVEADEEESSGSRPLFWLVLVIVAAAVIGMTVLQLRGAKVPLPAKPQAPAAQPAVAPEPVAAPHAQPAEEQPPEVQAAPSQPADEPVAPPSELAPESAPAAAASQDTTPAASPPPVEQPEPGAVAPTPAPQ